MIQEEKSVSTYSYLDYRVGLSFNGFWYVILMKVTTYNIVETPILMKLRYYKRSTVISVS